MVGRVELDANGEALGGGLAHGLDDLDYDLGAGSGGAAVRVGALVRLFRQKLCEQVAVGGVDLGAREAGVGRQLGRRGKAPDHIVDVGLGHGLGRAKHERRDELGQQAAAKVERHGAGGQVLGEEAAAAGAHGRLAARVVDLDQGRRTTGVAGLGPGAPRGEHLFIRDVVIEGDIARRSKISSVNLHVAW